CGDVAEAIAAYHEQHGGYLTREDLAAVRSRYEPPVSVRWRDFEVVTCGPWCQGPVLAQALQMLARAGLDGLERNGAPYAHLVIEVLKGAFADREYRYGDPRFVDVGMDELLSDPHLAARVAAIDSERANPRLPDSVGADSRPGVEPWADAALGRPRLDTSYL